MFQFSWLIISTPTDFIHILFIFFVINNKHGLWYSNWKELSLYFVCVFVKAQFTEAYDTFIMSFFAHLGAKLCEGFFFLFFSIFTHEKAMGYVNRSHKFSCFCKEDEYCQWNIIRGVERGELNLVKLFIFQLIYSKQ